MSPPNRSSWFDRGIEVVGWAAVAVALLFQNPYGELGPEADRFLVLQALALVAVILAVVGAARQSAPAAPAARPAHSANPGLPALRGLVISPIARWALALGGAGALAAALSVDPLRSLFGAPPRLFGFASELALLLLFFLLVPRLATVASRERWETALLAATGALVAYALLQWAGLDPLRWQVDWQGRPTAAQGNPLFLAQALAWLVPIAAGRAVCRWRAGEHRAAISAALLAMLAGVVLVRTGARGPLLGLAVAALVFAAVAGLGSPFARPRRAGVALASLLGLALIAGAWVGLQRIDRLSGTASQRLLLWSSVVRLFETSPPLRLVVGFGAESLPIVLPPHLPPELPERIWRPDLYHDRAHNAVLDALAAGGLLRLLAGLGLAVAAAGAALRLAGARRPGPGAAADPVSPTAVAAGERWRFVALTAALAGHTVAAQFGVATAATATLFWLTLALLAGAGLRGAGVRSAGHRNTGVVPPPVGGGKRAAEALRRHARSATRMRWLAVGGLLAVVAVGAWVPEQRAGDAMGGRVALLLLLAAVGIGLAFASALPSAQVNPGRDRANAAPMPLAQVSARRRVLSAVAAVAVAAALAGLFLVLLPQFASGIALKAGRTALEAGRADLAVPLLARAHRLFPGFEDPAVALARAEQRLAERAADGASRDAAFDRAAAVLAGARRRHPGLAQLALEEAHLAARRADSAAEPQVRQALFESAVTGYREVLARDPQSSTVHRGLGAALLALGRLEEAGDELAASVRLAPRSLESRLLLGRLRLTAGDEAGARAAFEAAREIDAMRARRLLEGLVRARPGDPEALRDLALFEIVEGRRKEAIAALERAMALTPPQDLPPLVRLTGLAAKVP